MHIKIIGVMLYIFEISVKNSIEWYITYAQKFNSEKSHLEPKWAKMTEKWKVYSLWRPFWVKPRRYFSKCDIPLDREFFALHFLKSAMYGWDCIHTVKNTVKVKRLVIRTRSSLCNFSWCKIFIKLYIRLDAWDNELQYEV